MDTSKLNSVQRQQRSNIRALFLTATIDEMERAKANYNDFGKKVLEEMIQTCRDQGVTDHGKTH